MLSRDIQPIFARWLPPVADDGGTKGVGATLPIVQPARRVGFRPLSGRFGDRKTDPLTKPGAKGARSSRSNGSYLTRTSAKHRLVREITYTGPGVPVGRTTRAKVERGHAGVPVPAPRQVRAASMPAAIAIRTSWDRLLACIFAITRAR